MQDNLFHWHVQMFDFDKGSPLQTDLEAYGKKFGIASPHVLLEMKFPGDYPFSPYVSFCSWRQSDFFVQSLYSHNSTTFPTVHWQCMKWNHILCVMT